MKLIEATCKFAPRTRDTKFGQKINAVFSLPDGSEATVWAPPGHPLESVRRGGTHRLAKVGNGYRLIEREESPPTPGPESSPYTLGDDQKRAIAAYLEGQTALLKFCWQQAEQAFPDLSPEIVQKHATTLFIAAQKKFGL